ncbi:nickel-dependent lactate racemase [Candidatus Bathyarchaeota archaeon]|nr:nickel-dependent lactate racemase [Candidatus Bathyarchaeota archaeon]MBS7628009.1 nickel-dependent lactate racemase [Candidatus Bathyarchaeota archaeon]
MVEVWLPYGDTEVVARIPTELFLGSIEPPRTSASKNPEADILEAIEKPLGTPRLSDLISQSSRIALIIEDSLPAPLLHISVRRSIDTLVRAGAREDNITLILATGFEGMKGFGSISNLLVSNAGASYRILVHNPMDRGNLLSLGETRRGTKVLLNRIFTEADFKMSLGVIELHEFAGYMGVRTSILPGISGISTIKESFGLLTDENARPGILEGNPVDSEMWEANSMAKQDFTLSFILDRHGNLVKALGGEGKRVFEDGVKTLDSIRKVPIDDMADIVLVAADGAPKDKSLSEAVGAIQNSLDVLKRGGFLILVAECREGYGSKTFYDWMMGFKDFETLKRNIRKGYEFGSEKAYILAKAIEKGKVILVSSLPNFYAQEVFKIRRASTVNEALEIAYHGIGRKAKVLVLPYGRSTLPVRAKAQKEEDEQPLG